MRLLPALLLVLLLLSAPAALAATPPSADADPVVQNPRPQVSISRDPSGRLEEYRYNGRLYMVKVLPAKGAPYYLIDSDGDGELDRRRNDLDPDLTVPGWVTLGG